MKILAAVWSWRLVLLAWAGAAMTTIGATLVTYDLAANISQRAAAGAAATVAGACLVTIARLASNYAVVEELPR